LRGDRGQHAIGGNRQPAQIHQHRQPVVCACGLVHLDARPAVTQLVVQQHRTRQEPQPLTHPVQFLWCGRGLGQADCGCPDNRRLRQQRLFLVHALQLPPSQQAEQRRHHHRQRPSEHLRVLSRHDKPSPSR